MKWQHSMLLLWQKEEEEVDMVELSRESQNSKVEATLRDSVSPLPAEQVTQLKLTSPFSQVLAEGPGRSDWIPHEVDVDKASLPPSF